MVETAKNITACIGAVLSIISFLTIFFKPFRKWIVNAITHVNDKALNEIKDMLGQHIEDEKERNKKVTESLVCVTRNAITSIYYQYFESKALPMYERENLIKLYDSYETNGGNSFVHTIVDEMLQWKVY